MPCGVQGGRAYLEEMDKAGGCGRERDGGVCVIG